MRKELHERYGNHPGEVQMHTWMYEHIVLTRNADCASSFHPFPPISASRSSLSLTSPACWKFSYVVARVGLGV